MLDEYQVFQVPRSARITSKIEPLGTKFKFWYEDENRRKFLFKEGRVGSGEDWSEKVSSELCQLFGIPHAEYAFAVWHDDSGKEHNGVISPSFLKDGDVLFTGLALLDIENARNLEKVLDFWPPTEVRRHFIGYLVFDTWIGNTDRHWENWGVVVHATKQGKKKKRFKASLAPSFDHASSLGVRLSDENRKIRLKGQDHRQTVAKYAARCKTPFSGIIDGQEKKCLTTYEMFIILASKYPDDTQYWVDRLSGVREQDVEQIFSRVPSSRLSKASADFAIALLRENRQKLICLGGGLR